MITTKSVLMLSIAFHHVFIIHLNNHKEKVFHYQCTSLCYHSAFHEWCQRKKESQPKNREKKGWKSQLLLIGGKKIQFLSLGWRGILNLPDCECFWRIYVKLEVTWFWFKTQANTGTYPMFHKPHVYMGIQNMTAFVSLLYLLTL